MLVLMQKILSFLVTGSKLGALMCFSLMGIFISPVAATDVPPCHQMKAMHTNKQQVESKSNHCNACEVSEKVWNNPLVQFSSDFFGKILKQTKFYECPFKTTEEPNCKFRKNNIATKDPPDRTHCPCQQLKMKNSIQLRL